MIATAPSLLCHPPAPLNGGKLEYAPAKVGAWVWQPKVNDERVVIHTPTRSMWTQYGEPYTKADAFEPALDHLARLSFAAEWLDAGTMYKEAGVLRGCIVVFDIIDGTRPMLERWITLHSMFPLLPMVGSMHAAAANQVFAIDCFGVNEHFDFVGCDPLHCYRLLQAQNEKMGRRFYEGLVAKRVRSYYPVTNTRPKIKFADWIKHRFDQP